MQTASRKYLLEYMHATTGRTAEVISAMITETNEIPGKAVGITGSWPNAHLVYYLKFDTYTRSWEFEEYRKVENRGTHIGNGNSQVNIWS